MPSLFKGLTLLVALTLAQAALSFEARFLIVDMAQGPLDYTWELKGPHPKYSSLVLDCHSFIHELRFTHTQTAQAESFFLYSDECHALEELLYDGLSNGAPQCLELSTQPPGLRVHQDVEACAPF